MTEEIVDEEPALSECQHYWKIASPNGPISIGVCKICGERSEFKNSIQGSGWDRENPQSRRAKQAKSTT